MSNNRFLMAVDKTAASQREFQYVGEMIRGREDIKIFLLHVFPSPPPDYYTQGGNQEDYIQEYEEQAAVIFKECSTSLSKFINVQQISTESVMAEGKSLSDVILTKQKECECDTVVLGKRGISKAEEFLFGSVSNAVVRASHDFTVWVVS